MTSLSLLLQVSWLLLCLSVLALFTCLVLLRAASKPLAHTCLRDRITCDLARLHIATSATGAAMNIILASGAEVPYALALLISLALEVFAASFVACLSVGAAVQYILVSKRVVELSDDFSEDGLCLFIRVTITAIGLLAQLPKYLYNTYPIYFHILNRTLKVSIFVDKRLIEKQLFSRKKNIF